MTITFRNYQDEDIPQMCEIWNDILIDGMAFPGETLFDKVTFSNYLTEQSKATCMFFDNQLAGFFIVHPNNIGRCSHVANASYCMNKAFRGKKLFSSLVQESLNQAKNLGFKGMQFNAVVASNTPAIHTYQKVGFEIIGCIPKGFRLKDDRYSDMLVMYKSLVE